MEHFNICHQYYLHNHILNNNYKYTKNIKILLRHVMFIIKDNYLNEYVYLGIFYSSSN